jgi:hypothetical protein
VSDELAETAAPLAPDTGPLCGSGSGGGRAGQRQEVTCTATVRRIEVQATLYLQNPADGWWYLQAASDMKSYYNTAFGQNNAAVPCQDGNWVGWMNYRVTFMSGYVAGDSGFGNQVAITCSR